MINDSVLNSYVLNGSALRYVAAATFKPAFITFKVYPEAFVFKVYPETFVFKVYPETLVFKVYPEVFVFKVVT